MKNTRTTEKRTRGWLPNDSICFTTISTKHSRKLEKWVVSPFATLGTLMIVASLLSAVFGTVLVWAYLSPPIAPGSAPFTTFYSGLYVAILSLATFVLGMYSGILLLARSHIARAVTCMFAILCFGFATLVIPILEGLAPQSGLLVASPMIISSVTALFAVAFNMVSQRTKRITPNEPPNIRERVFGGLGAAGGGLTLIGIVFHFTPIYPKQAGVVMIVIGVPLIAAALLVRRTYKH
jgi:hypothetical protein